MLPTNARSSDVEPVQRSRRSAPRVCERTRRRRMVGGSRAIASSRTALSSGCWHDFLSWRSRGARCDSSPRFSPPRDLCHEVGDGTQTRSDGSSERHGVMATAIHHREARGGEGGRLTERRSPRLWVTTVWLHVQVDSAVLNKRSLPFKSEACVVAGGLVLQRLRGGRRAPQGRGSLARWQHRAVPGRLAFVGTTASKGADDGDVWALRTNSEGLFMCP